MGSKISVPINNKELEKCIDHFLKKNKETSFLIRDIHSLIDHTDLSDLDNTNNLLNFYVICLFCTTTNLFIYGDDYYLSKDKMGMMVKLADKESRLPEINIFDVINFLMNNLDHYSKKLSNRGQHYILNFLINFENHEYLKKFFECVQVSLEVFEIKNDTNHTIIDMVKFSNNNSIILLCFEEYIKKINDLRHNFSCPKCDKNIQGC